LRRGKQTSAKVKNQCGNWLWQEVVEVEVISLLACILYFYF